MADELEYVITGALLECSEGTVPMPFQATPRNVRLQGLKVGNASDKTPYLNIPSFVICKKLTQMAGGTPVPCVPAPIMWQDTYPVQVNKQEVLIFRSCIRCSSGQGKIEFLTSGQTPVPPEVTQQLEEMQKESEEVLKEAEAEKNSVGEAGLVEGMIPVWGSGRDMVHSMQTGDTFGAVLNAGFLVWDVASIAAGVVSFGTATVAMQGAKAGAKGLIKAGAKVAAKGAARKLASMLAKSAAMKKGLLKGLTKLASTRVCMLACFPAGTSVAVEEGYRNIEELQLGDRVWSRDEFTGQLALQPITHTSERETDHLIHLRMGGERVQTTAEHPFFTHQGWQKAGTLVIGQEVMRSDGQWVAITQADHRTEFDQPQLVYNIEVAHAHTYFIGKWMWWVHNANVCVSKMVKNASRAAKAKKKQLLSSAPSKVKSKRLEYLGKTPSKSSKTGRDVIKRMEVEKKFRDVNGKREVLGPDGKWYDISKTDMGHLDDAVSWWNREGRQYGPKSKEVRDWMKDPANYELEPSSINRSRGAKLKEKYLPPLKK
ncbi:polymorphic toxin-type HINT domain-containing protein [Fibrella forsythiae]|uniref:DUF4280 domain-containing protein n=1 Tax=Fibrella forsythiae TaxID=2817061 RepID=A0ABS3JLA7_9BACT|nr:polymorphic toxin-type HINT domain-containing protein [Fibrella forsythiae]MBO0950799.1 DUF4280 domain-containing protein [Fibrella forsythiae]